MSLQVVSWDHFGYRKLGPLPATGGGITPAELVEKISHVSDYESIADHWVRRRARRKGVQFPENIKVQTVLDKSTPLGDDRLAFVEEYSRSKWVNFDTRRITATTENLVALVGNAETEDRWRGLYRLTQALFYAQPERLRMMLRRHVAPCFFRLYPEGKIVVLRYDTGVEDAAAVLRSMYAMAQSPLPALTQGAFQGFKTLQSWHYASLTRMLPALLDLFDFLFYPFVGGVSAGLPGLAFLFLLEPPEEYRPERYPRSWLAYPNTTASFGREDIDPFELVRDYPGPVYRLASHQRFLHAQGFSATERLDLLHWFIGRVNRLLYELTDVCNFTVNLDPREFVDPTLAFGHLLTVDRLLRKTLLAMSLEEPLTAKLMAFEIADLYDTLSERLQNRTAKTEFFKRLFHTQDAPALIAPVLGQLPPPFGDYLRNLTAQLYGKIEDMVLDSIWVRSKVTSSREVLVRNEDLTAEAPMPAAHFVSEVMRSYRNAHHGYFAGDPAPKKPRPASAGTKKPKRPPDYRPSRFLFLVDGNLPAEMSALPPLWWLAYLAHPGIVGWRHLELGHYD